MALDLFTPEGFFHPSMTGFTIVNSNSTKDAQTTRLQVPLTLFFLTSMLPS